MVGIFINRRVNDYIGNVVLLSSFYALFDIKLICPVYLYNANSVIFREVDKMVNRFSNHSFIFAIPHNTHNIRYHSKYLRAPGYDIQSQFGGLYVIRSPYSAGHSAGCVTC